MGYQKHFAYYHKGDWRESYLCVCPRTGNHMVTRPGSEPADLPLFELDGMGEIVAS